MSHALAPSIGPLHRAWRSLPQGPRRAAARSVAGWLAPTPDHPPPPVRPGLAVGGELDRASGLGEAARLYLAGLHALGTPSWTADAPPGVPLALHLNAAALPTAMLRLGRRALRGRRVIGVWPWELAEVPPAWHDGFRYVHEVWAPSRFSAESVSRAAPPGFPPVRVVPYPVSCADAPVTPIRAGPDGTVVTLAAFSLASSFARKNPLAAIAAHRAAFGPRPDRLLLLRASGGDAFPAELRLIHEAATGLPNIRIDTRILPRDDARALLAGADIVLSLHRSEGFGLVPAEAMLLARPVIATDFSGPTDFIDASCAIPVPFRLIPAIDPRGVFQAPGAVWAEPDIDAAAQALRHLADDAGVRQTLGAAARARVLERLGPAALGAALQALGSAPG